MLWILVVIETLVLLGLVQTMHRVQAEIRPKASDSVDESKVLLGKMVPDFETADVRGNLVSSRGLRGKKTVLVFVSPVCRECVRLLQDLGPFKRRGDEILVICRGDSQDCQRLPEKYALSVPVVPDAGDKISRLLQIDGVPMAVVIGKEGRIASYGYLEGGAEIEEFVTQATGEAVRS